eukprot:scaffold68026_cov18-Tisochrysis_lutea.AAC.2
MVIFASIVHSIFLNVMLTAFADMHGANMDGCDTVSLHGTKLTLHHKSIIKSAECVGQTMWKCVEGAAVFRSGIYCLQAPHDHCECLKHPNIASSTCAWVWAARGVKTKVQEVIPNFQDSDNEEVKRAALGLASRLWVPSRTEYPTPMQALLQKHTSVED